MDEILERFNSTLGSVDGSGDQKQNYEDLYKNWGRLGHQEDRRKQLLDSQKGDRNKKIDNFRGIMEIVDAVENRYDRAYYRPSIYVAGFNKASHSYRNVLMLSEWLIEKPEDFHENWYVVPCPKGTRMIVVANRGTTKCYSKYGKFMWECRSALPGGNPIDKKQNGKCCVLDCFWQEKNNTIYILDLLAWNSQNMTNGEMEFRHFWLTSQLADFASLRIISNKNDVIFSMLPKTPCDPDSFNTFMSKYPAFEGGFPHLDGLLFYHKKAQYMGGETPLVGWLFPYMVQEVLGADILVHENYVVARPAGYINQADFIEKFEAKYAKRNKHLNLSNSSSLSSNSDVKEQIEDVKKSTRGERIEKEERKVSVKNGISEETMEAEESNVSVEKGVSEETMEAEESKVSIKKTVPEEIIATEESKVSVTKDVPDETMIAEGSKVADKMDAETESKEEVEEK